MSVNWPCKVFMVFAKVFLSALFFQKCSANIVSDRYYPRYHLASPYGWMNDPNGFCIFGNEYHLFYQYNPLSSQEPGIAHWGHAKSPDLFHWENLPIAMYPDSSYDCSGVFSGSAIVENDTMYVFYTGNVNHPDEIPDHEQHQALGSSTDGVNFKKYERNPVIEAEEHQPNIRDPKVWKHCDTYFMVLGNSFNNDSLGRVLLYSSKNLVSWQQESVLYESDGSLGYMWECPDFFELDGKHVLLFSPQGVEPQGDKYKNLYQTGYIVGDFDYETRVFTPMSEFRELDHGHDFYATQTILGESGKRIVIAWFDMWEQVYPERDDGSTGQMTIPRCLSLTADNKLVQKPFYKIQAVRGRTLYSGKASCSDTIKLQDNAGEIRVKAAESQDFELLIESENQLVSISYDNENGKITLDRGGEDGIRRTAWQPVGKLRWHIFLDTSSIELFCGDGEVTFSSRFFPNGKVQVRLGNSSLAEYLTVYEMQRTVSGPA